MSIMNTNVNNNVLHDFKYTKQTAYITYVIPLIIWIICSLRFFYTLKNSKYTNDKKFIPYMLFIIAIPLFLLFKAIYLVEQTPLIGLTPFTPVCVNGSTLIDESLKSKGIVGIVDYECLARNQRGIWKGVDIIMDHTDFAIKLLFSIVIFLFGLTYYPKLEYTKIAPNEVFIKNLIQTCSLCAVLVIGSVFIGNDLNYISILLNILFSNIVLLVISSLIILISYLLFNLLKIYF